MDMSKGSCINLRYGEARMKEDCGHVHNLRSLGAVNRLKQGKTEKEARHVDVRILT